MTIPRLRYRADFRTLFLLGLQLTLLTMHYTGVVTSLWIWVLTCPLAFACCIIAHNHMHAGTFRQKRWNNALSLLIMMGSGQPPTGMVTAHNERHHQHRDSDADFVRTSMVRSSVNILNILAFPFLSVAKMYREKPSDLPIWKEQRPKLYRQAVRERVIFYSLLAGLLVLNWQQALLTFVVPWVFGHYWLIATNLIQHQDCDQASDWNHSRNLTGYAANWLLLNNGFHTAHHIKPSLHWSLLPEFHRDQVGPRMDPKLNHRSLVHLLWLRILRSPRDEADLSCP